MPANLGILFLHHTTDRVTRRNLLSVRRHHPRAVIATMSAGEMFPGGYNLEATPHVKHFHSMNTRRGSDWLVCSWFLQRKEKCRRWWIIEWDTFCTTSAEKYYRAVWTFPFVAASVRLVNREPEWAWFSQITKLPEPLRSFALGAVPFLYLVSDGALQKICRQLLAQPCVAGNAELRFATAANACGLPPCGYSPPGDQISWMTHDRLAERKTIFHPVKQLPRRKSRMGLPV